jgi:biotin carboxylase
LRRTFFDVEGKAIVHAELHCRPDRYQQVLEFVNEPVIPESTKTATKATPKERSAGEVALPANSGQFETR